MATERQAISLLKKYSKDNKSFNIILAHVKKVQEIALRIVEDVPDVDLEVIKIGSLLHDIGRFECPPGKDTIKHGLIGAEILRKESLEKYALIAERHLGAGISKKDIVKQEINLPLKDYTPKTKEEKIIAHADNLTKGNKEISARKAIERYEKELGHETAEKVRKLAEEVEGMKNKND